MYVPDYLASALCHEDLLFGIAKHSCEKVFPSGPAVRDPKEVTARPGVELVQIEDQLINGLGIAMFGAAYAHVHRWIIHVVQSRR